MCIAVQGIGIPLENVGKVQHREPTPMIESSEDEEEADEDDAADEEANEDIPGAFIADLECPESAFAASLGPEPHSYRQALMHPDAAQWTKAAEEEIEAHSAKWHLGACRFACRAQSHWF